MGSGVKFVLVGVSCRLRQRSVFETWVSGSNPCPPRSSPILADPEANEADRTLRQAPLSRQFQLFLWRLKSRGQGRDGA